MAGPSLKVYFINEEEHQNVQQLAATLNMTAKSFVMAATRQMAHTIIEKRRASYEANRAQVLAEESPKLEEAASE